MTSEGLGEVFKRESADMCGGKFPLVSMGGRADRQTCADGERGPPSTRAEINISRDGMLAENDSIQNNREQL